MIGKYFDWASAAEREKLARTLQAVRDRGESAERPE